MLAHEALGPLRTGFAYGIVAALVALAADLRFLFLDPNGVQAWILAAIEGFRTQLALAAFMLIAIIAAFRVRPTRLDSGVPYRAILLRDCALAATVVGVVVGVTLLLTTALQATLLSGDVRAYAAEAAPRVASYLEEVRRDLRDPPSSTSAAEVESSLQPPTLRDLGRSIANLVLRTILLGSLGAAVGALRGRGRADAGSPRPEKTPEP
jgi:hypothetical protein